MKILTCAHCGIDFQAKSIYSNTKHCSHICRFKAILPSTFDDECFIWPMSKNKVSGYGQFNTYDGNKVITSYAHRMSYEAFFGHLPEGAFVLHKCDNPSCINPNHLFLGSQSDNMVDMTTKGRHCKYTGWVDKEKNPQTKYPERRPKGQSHGAAKLSDDDVRKIRSSTLSHAALAREFCVSDTAISLIRKNKTWRHLLQ